MELKKLTKAMFVVQLLGLPMMIKAQSTAPVVVTNKFVARGSTAALGRSTITGSNIKEDGFCYSSETKVPTINDSTTTEYYSRNGKLYYMKNLTPATFYYVRAYAINANGEVGYGNVVKIATLPKSNVTLSLWTGSADDAAKSRLQAAVTEAQELYNTWSGINSCTVSVSYSAGTPTADGSYWSKHINVGASAGYQRTGTMLHELNHVMGVGQVGAWTNSTDLRSNRTWGYWLGDRANKMIQFIENNDEVRVYGDGTHMWASGGSPLAYGINGAHEDSGNKVLYMGNVLITHALHEDGMSLPASYDNGYPYYSVDIEDSTKYYIKNVDEASGLYTSYLGVGRFTTTALHTEVNDSSAWYISFNPEIGKYMFKNVATGKYLTHTTQSSSEVIKVTKLAIPGSDQEFQLMPTREDVTIGEEWSCFTARPVSFCFPSYKGMTINKKTAAVASFKLASSATEQHWFIMTDEEVQKFQKVVESMTIDSLVIGNKLYSAFEVGKKTYNIARHPSTIADSCQISVVLNSHFNGTCEITQPTSIPGTGKVVLKDLDGNITDTYTLNFYPNIIYAWDAEGATGSASKPNKHGWGSTSTYQLLWGSANGLNTHYMDPGKGTSMVYEGYVVNGGHAYDQSRILMLYYKDGGETYHYTFTGLEPSTQYVFNGGLAWTESDEGAPKVVVSLVNGTDTIPVTDKTSPAMLVNAECTASATEKDITPFEFTFTTPADITAETPFALQFDCQSAVRLVLTDLAVLKPVSTSVTEDINGDGVVDSQDVLAIYNCMQSADDSSVSSIYDVNADGVVDSQDVLQIYEYIKQH